MMLREPYYVIFWVVSLIYDSGEAMLSPEHKPAVRM